MYASVSRKLQHARLGDIEEKGVGGWGGEWSGVKGGCCIGRRAPLSLNLDLACNQLGFDSYRNLLLWLLLLHIR